MHFNLYERVAAHGAGPLEDGELLRVLLRSGSGTTPLTKTVAAVLAAYPRLANLNTATVADLTALPGIGLSKAVGLIAALELGQRVVAQQAARFGTVASSEAIGARLIRQWQGVSQEQVLAIYVDSQLQVIAEAIVAVGGQDAATIDPRVVFAQALRHNAAALLLAHNHPSGLVTPSAADALTTERFAQGGALLGISLLDHLIIGHKHYYSFAQHHRLNYSK
ncbi:RadC family protein [Lacticaseibacillus jixiensis]|uniref:RadC family protein n=1 Tax=Lacticaseibacillus jixiensis TaxID=3231926 RepID=UPI0036F33083